MTCLIGACLALATALFMVSLPLGLTPYGKALRQWAGALLLAALAPSVACGLFAQVAGRGGGQPPTLVGILAGIGLLAIVSVIAYLILVIRGRLRPRQRRSPDGWLDRRGYQYDDDPQGSRWERRG